MTCSLTVAHFARTNRVFSLYTNSHPDYPAGPCNYLGEFTFVHQAEFNKGVVGGDWYSLSNEVIICARPYDVTSDDVFVLQERARMNILGASNSQWSKTNNHAFDPDQLQVYILQWISFDCLKKVALLPAAQMMSPQDQGKINAVRVWEKRRKDHLAKIQQLRKIQMAKDRMKRSQAVLQALGRLQYAKVT